MQKYEMVFLDLDGTLLDSRQQISPRTKKLLERLQRQGVILVLCSARSPGGVESVAAQGKICGPIVCYNGGLILDEKRSIIREQGIALSEARELKRWIRENFSDLCLSAYLYDVWITDDIGRSEIQEESALSGCHPLEIFLEDVGDTILAVHKLLCIGDPRQLLVLSQLGSRRYPKLQFVFSKDSYLEITAKRATKAAALRTLRLRRNVERGRIVAFGDHFTDREMLEEAGLGIAMGNAPEQVRAAADQVTASNDEEGVYLALKELRFGGR